MNLPANKILEHTELTKLMASFAGHNPLFLMDQQSRQKVTHQIEMAIRQYGNPTSRGSAEIESQIHQKAWDRDDYLKKVARFMLNIKETGGRPGYKSSSVSSQQKPFLPPCMMTAAPSLQTQMESQQQTIPRNQFLNHVAWPNQMPGLSATATNSTYGYERQSAGLRHTDYINIEDTDISVGFDQDPPTKRRKFISQATMNLDQSLQSPCSIIAQYQRPHPAPFSVPDKVLTLSGAVGDDFYSGLSGGKSSKDSTTITATPSLLTCRFCSEDVYAELDPCGHSPLCYDCAQVLFKACPECKKGIKHVKVILDSLPMCKVCNEEKSNVKFLPCEHTPACFVCSKRMKKCITCESHIKEKKIIGPVPKETYPEKFLCKICFDHCNDAVFLCGHSTCRMCAQHLQECPFCRKPIEHIIHTYNN